MKTEWLLFDPLAAGKAQMANITPDQEHRVARRQRVLKQGKIVLPNGLTVIDCGVRDMSETGAKLLCGDPGAIPNRFRLVLTGERLMRDVKVVWRRPDCVGVEFTSAPTKAPLLKF